MIVTLYFPDDEQSRTQPNIFLQVRVQTLGLQSKIFVKSYARYSRKATFDCGGEFFLRLRKTTFDINP